MVDSTSIVIAIVALVASIGAAGLTVWSSYLTEEKKNQKESKALIAKYGDPLLLAAQDLQSRLSNLTDWRIGHYILADDDRRDNLLLYTAFVFGQWFSYTHILRRKTQFLRLETEKANRSLSTALANVMQELSEDSYGADGRPFMLWRGDQMAIGQIMTVREGEELLCMGYAEFRRRCTDARLLACFPQKGRNHSRSRSVHGQHMDDDNGDDDARGGSAVDLATTSEEPSDRVWRTSRKVVPSIENADPAVGGDGSWAEREEFRRWFIPIVEGVIAVAEAKYSGRTKEESPPDQRLRRVQHLLVDLIDILDPKRLRSEAHKMRRCHRAVECYCSACDRKPMRECNCRNCEGARDGSAA